MKEEEEEEGGGQCSWADPEEEKGQGDPLSHPREGALCGTTTVVKVPPGAAPVAMEQRSSMDKQLEAHLLGTDPQPQWPSKARPRPVQWCPRSRTWEVSWLDSENLFPRPECDRCWWPLLF